MKRIITILLTLVMVFSCSFTAMAYTAADTRVKIIDSNGIRDITSKLGNRYITDNENLMIPAIPVFEEMGLQKIEWLATEEKCLGALNPMNNRNAGITFTGHSFYVVNGEYGGNFTIKPLFCKGIPMIAIQDLPKLWKTPVKFDTNTGTYYIVIDETKATSTIQSFPDVVTGENLMAIKKSNENPNAIKVKLIINGNEKDITATTIPQHVNGKLMIDAKPIIEAIGSVVFVKDTDRYWAGIRLSDNRVYIVYYETGVMANGYNNSDLDGINASVKPKLINDSLLLYYKDFEGLTGGVANYDAKTKTCTISITDEWLVNNSVANNTINSEVITNQDTANTNSVQEPATVENYKTAQQKEREREALERQREREREERQKRLAELEAELEQLQKEREARERQKEQAEQDRASSQKTVRVLTKDGWVWMSKAEADARKSSEKKVKILREGEGWIWVTEEEARQYRSNSNSSSNTNTSSSATTGRYVIGSGYQSAEDFNKSNNTTSTEKRKVLRAGVGWVYE